MFITCFIPYTFVNLRIPKKGYFMNLVTLKKKFDFIPEPLYQKLDKRTREKLLTFRRKGHNLNQKTKRIENLKKKIDEEKVLLNEMKKDYTDLFNQIQHLRKDFYFTCSIVSYKNKYGTRYFNLLICRTGLPNKSVGLGNEEKITDRLLEYYKGKRKIIGEIKKDWKTFLKVESNGGDTYYRILEMIMSNPSGFNEQKGGITISIDDLFPLD